MKNKKIKRIFSLMLAIMLVLTALLGNQTNMKAEELKAISTEKKPSIRYQYFSLVYEKMETSTFEIIEVDFADQAVESFSINGITFTNYFKVIGNSIVIESKALKDIPSIKHWTNYELIINFTNGYSVGDIIISIRDDVGSMPGESPSAYSQTKTFYLDESNNIEFLVDLGSSAESLATLKIAGQEVPTNKYSLNNGIITIDGTYLASLNLEVNKTYKVTPKFNDGAVIIDKLSITVKSTNVTATPTPTPLPVINSIEKQIAVYYADSDNDLVFTGLTVKASDRITGVTIGTNYTNDMFKVDGSNLIVLKEFLKPLNLKSELLLNVKIDFSDGTSTSMAKVECMREPLNTARISPQTAIYSLVDNNDVKVVFDYVREGVILESLRIGQSLKVTNGFELNSSNEVIIKGDTLKTLNLNQNWDYTLGFFFNDGTYQGVTEAKIYIEPGSITIPEVTPTPTPIATPTPEVTPSPGSLVDYLDTTEGEYNVWSNDNLVLSGMNLPTGINISYIEYDGIRPSADYYSVIGDKLTLSSKFFNDYKYNVNSNIVLQIYYSNETKNNDVIVRMYLNPSDVYMLDTQEVTFNKFGNNNVNINFKFLDPRVRITYVQIDFNIIDDPTLFSYKDGILSISRDALTNMNLEPNIGYRVQIGLSLYNDIRGKVTLYALEDSTTPTPTDAPTSTPTPTNVPTSTPKPTDVPTSTPTDVPTSTPAPTDVPTSTPTPTEVPTSTPKPTDVPTSTPKPTEVPTSAPTPTPTPSTEGSGNGGIVVIPTLAPVLSKVKDTIYTDGNGAKINLNVVQDSLVSVFVNGKILDSNNYKIEDSVLIINNSALRGNSTSVKTLEIVVDNDGIKESKTINLVVGTDVPTAKFQTDKVLNVGNVYKLNKGLMAFEGVSVKYTTSNPKVATVTKNGNIIPVSDGTAIITAYYEIDGKAVVQETVINVKGIVEKGTRKALSYFDKINGNASIIFNKNLSLGKKINISNPNFEKDYDLTFISSNEKVAVIDNGIVTPVSTGAVIITVNAKNLVTGKILSYSVNLKVVK